MSGGYSIDELVVDLAGHVKDGDSFHYPFGIHLYIPEFLTNIGITKYIVVEFAVAIAMCAVFIPLAVKIKGGKPIKGRFWNMIELLLVFLKDQVIVPSIGKKHAAPFVPYLWTLFFFVLFCNLAGMVPWSGTPTGSLSVTTVLALSTFGVVIVTGMRLHGVKGYWLGLIPSVDVHPAMAVFLKPLLFGIEVAGLIIKHGVLAIRLMANMFAGHLSLAVFMSFIPLSAGIIYVWVLVTPASIAMSVALSMLELLIAFLQAYVITFLSSLFIGMSVHQH